MAGNALETLTIRIDQEGMDKLQERGKAVLPHPSIEDKWIVLSYDEEVWNDGRENDGRPGVI